MTAGDGAVVVGRRTKSWRMEKIVRRKEELRRREGEAGGENYGLMRPIVTLSVCVWFSACVIQWGCGLVGVVYWVCGLVGVWFSEVVGLWGRGLLGGRRS